MPTRYTAAEQQELLKWSRRFGVGFIEANVPEKKVSEKWAEVDLSSIDYEKEIQTGKYDNGIAIRLGKTFSGKYLTALDFDDWPTILAYFGGKDKVHSWANDTLIEWHQDWGSLHALILTDEPMTNRKIAVDGGYLEVRCIGQLLFASPSTHTDGHKWQALGKAASPKLLSPLEVTRLKIKIDQFCDDYVSSTDKAKYQAYLENPGTVLGVKQGRHDATVFIAKRYYWAYKDGWLTLNDEERFNRAWKWHEDHCNPPRSRKEFDLIRRWVENRMAESRDNWFSRIRREQEEKAQIRFKANEQERLLAEEIKTRAHNMQTLSVSEALRLLPIVAESRTEIVKVRGMISSYKELHVMIVGWVGVCPFCRKVYHESYEKPLFSAPQWLYPKCTNFDAPEHPAEFASIKNASQNDKEKNIFTDESGNKFEMVFDKDGKIKRSVVYLKYDFEYRDAVEIDLQDDDKHEEITTLKTLLFGDDTKDVRLGEKVVTTGRIWIEPFTSNRDARLHKRLYTHSIEYKSRREIGISNSDKEAIERFAKRFGDKTLTKLSEMFAVDIFGNGHVKKGLMMCAASCGDDTENIQAHNRRTRLNGFIIGDTGLAKSPMLRRIVRIVPGSIYESMQNTTTKSLTAIVSKEGGDSPTVRLGPAPLAKCAILAANELGRTSAEDDLSQLLDVLEEGRFSVNKHGFHLPDIRSPTVVIGAANPRVDRDNSDRFDINDMGIIRPIIDRFDLIFVLKTRRDKQYLKDYNIHKNRFENTKAPNYDAYLEKHLLYCRRINPTVSEEAMTVLSNFYTGIAQKSGSPRIRETLFRCIKMVARLKLKAEADDKDAIEVCEFMNQLLQDRQEITNVPASPRDHTFAELLYKLEANVNPIALQELVEQVCFSDEYIDSYIGPNHDTRTSKKLRNLIPMLLGHSQVRKVQLKPIVLQWIPKSEVTNTDQHKPDCLCALCALCDPENTTPKKSTKITSDRASDERGHAQDKVQKPQKKWRGRPKTRAHRVHRAHSLDFDINKVKIINLMNGQCDILIARGWPKGKSNYPLAGMSGYLGNPYVILKKGEEPTKPWHCKTREEAISKHKEWLYHGTEVVNGRDPKEYRRRALEELPGHYEWGCFCAPQKCHGDTLKSWLRLKLRLMRRYTA